MIIQSLAHENKPYHRAALLPVENELKKRGHTVLQGGRKPYSKKKVDATMIAMTFYVTKENIKHLKKPVFLFPHGVTVVKDVIEDRILNADHIMQTGPIRTERTEELFPEYKGNLSIGFPKSDELFKGTSTRDEVIKEFVLDPKEPIVLFAPTYYQNDITHAGATPLLPQIEKLGLKNLLICLHNFDKQYNTMQGKRVIKASNKNKYLLAADLLIGDYSSITTEFSILDKPSIQIDITGKLEQFGLWGQDVNKTGPFQIGEIVKPEDLRKAIENALSDPGKYRQVRQEWIKKVFYNPGKATIAAADAIEEQYAKFNSNKKAFSLFGISLPFKK